jgi:RNA-binding protein YhbY
MSTERVELRAIGVTVQVGKKGLTKEALSEIEKQLRKRRIVKIRLLDSALKSGQKQELIDTILSTTMASLLARTGKVIIIKK